jgi:hypothetical protein
VSQLHKESKKKRKEEAQELGNAAKAKAATASCPDGTVQCI